MAMPKKGSRSIVINEVSYRWRTNKSGLNLLVSVEAVADGGANTLSVDTSVPLPNGCPCCSGVLMTPAAVEAYIRQALAEGWNPTTKGKPFLFVADAAMATGKT